MVASQRLATARRRQFNRLWQIYLPVAVMVIVTLFPFYWMFITSFKADPELYNVR